MYEAIVVSEAFDTTTHTPPHLEANAVLRQAGHGDDEGHDSHN
jgi:hypothetical protein